MPQPLDRTGEKTETMRARLVYQARKRGMLEGDLLLSTFARDNLAAMSHDELVQFDKVSFISERSETMSEGPKKGWRAASLRSGSTRRAQDG
jgi:succinate dehydrogenase flavin-adding protein (antitoxin of CptAB toxin-antitoxin module)